VTRPLIAHGELVVVETEDDVYLGTAEFRNGSVIVRTGYRGHPTRVPMQDVTGITVASEHAGAAQP
jgi:hypothetical protein